MAFLEGWHRRRFLFESFRPGQIFSLEFFAITSTSQSAALRPPSPSSHHPSIPDSCIPSFADCPRPVPSEIHLHSKESSWSKFLAPAFQCRVQSLLFPNEPLRARALSPTRYLPSHP